MLGDWLVVSQVLPVNPAAAVRGPNHVVTKGATPVLSPAEARKLLESIDTGALAGLRDRALLSVMLYSFARVSAVLGMRRQDYFGQGSRGWLRLHEKGGSGTTSRPTTGRRRRRLRRGGWARGAEGGALPDHGPGGEAADGPGARPAARPGDDHRGSVHRSLDRVSTRSATRLVHSGSTARRPRPACTGSRAGWHRGHRRDAVAARFGRRLVRPSVPVVIRVRRCRRAPRPTHGSSLASCFPPHHAPRQPSGTRRRRGPCDY